MEKFESSERNNNKETIILEIPGINGLSKTNGCEKAPEKILDVLKNEIYSKESGESLNIEDVKKEKLVLNNSDAEESGKKIYNKSYELLSNSDEKERVVFLGGDHSISYNTTRAFFDYCQSSSERNGGERENVKQPCLIVFDAHPDLMPVTRGAEEYPNHEEWLRQLIEDGFPVENILLVGVRNFDTQERNFIRNKGIETMSIEGFFEDIQGGGDMIMEFSRGKELYFSLDIDVVDPAFAPGTGYIETGGFSSREILYLIKRMNKIKNLKAIDIVEINPWKDERYDYRTVSLGSRILSELI